MSNSQGRPPSYALNMNLVMILFILCLFLKYNRVRYKYLNFKIILFLNLTAAFKNLITSPVLFTTMLNSKIKLKFKS